MKALFQILLTGSLTWRFMIDTSILKALIRPVLTVKVWTLSTISHEPFYLDFLPMELAFKRIFLRKYYLRSDNLDHILLSDTPPFFLSFCLFRAAPAAYGGSQTKDPVGATVTSLHQGHSNAGSEPLL